MQMGQTSAVDGAYSRFTRARYGVEWQTSSPLSLGVLVVGLFICLFAANASEPVFGSAVRQVFDDFGQLAASVGAAAVCLHRARSSSGRRVWGWRLLGAGTACWSAGQLAWAVSEVCLGLHPGTPSVPDIGFLAALPLEGVGLLLVAFPKLRTLSLARSSLDGLLIAASLLLLSYIAVWRPIITANRVPSAAVAVSLAYPFGDVLLGTLVVLAFSRACRRLRVSLVLILGGVSALAFSDAFFATRNLTGMYRTGSVTDCGWVVGFLLIALAAWTVREDDVEDTGELEGRWQGTAPYLVLLSAVLVRSVYVLSGGKPDSFIHWNGIAIITIAGTALIVQYEDRRQANRAQAYRDRHDELTGLPNMAALHSSIGRLLAQGERVAVLHCDLGRMRAVNSSLGRAAGDRLIQLVGERLSRRLSFPCEVGRPASDEFLILAPEPGDLSLLGSEVASLLGEPFEIDRHLHALSVNIGVAVGDAAHHRSEDVLRDAHHAMVRAKAVGPSRIEFFDPAEDRPTTVSELELEDELRTALSGGVGIIPFFQPVVRLDDAMVVGHEALVRWQHPKLGMLEPGRFLSLAEETGQVEHLGWWMLRYAGRIHGAQSVRDGWVAINVSAAQLGRGKLVEAVEEVMSFTGLTSAQLHLEVTETLLVRATADTRAELRSLADMGVSIALDDFGTGCSSLSLVRDLPVNTIKVDRSFVTPIESDRYARSIVKGVVTMCRDLDLAVVAEGIETPAQQKILLDMGCQYGQGYLYGRPAQRLLRCHEPAPGWVQL